MTGRGYSARTAEKSMRYINQQKELQEKRRKERAATTMERNYYKALAASRANDHLAIGSNIQSLINAFSR